MSNVNIFVAVPCYGSVPADFMLSMMRMQAKPPCNLTIKMVIGDSLVARARNTLAAEFVKCADCTHLLFLDSDLIFSSDQIKRLVDHDKEVVAGFYPKKQDGEVAWVCNAKLEGSEPDAIGLQEMRFMGTGFLLIKRCVFDRMIGRYGKEIEYHPDGRPQETEWDFFSVGPHKTADGHIRYLSEDWFFCQRWLDLGGKVFGDTKVIAKHIGHAVYPLLHQMKSLEVQSVKPEGNTDTETQIESVDKNRLTEGVLK